MGVGVSRSSLAGAVAKEGGVGIISTAQIGYDEEGFEKDQAACNNRAIHKHIKRAKELAQGNGLVGVNIMVALKHYEEMCIRDSTYSTSLPLSGMSGGTLTYLAGAAVLCAAAAWMHIRRKANAKGGKRRE